MLSSQTNIGSFPSPTKRDGQYFTVYDFRSTKTHKTKSIRGQEVTINLDQINFERKNSLYINTESMISIHSKMEMNSIEDEMQNSYSNSSSREAEGEKKQDFNEESLKDIVLTDVHPPADRINTKASVPDTKRKL